MQAGMVSYHLWVRVHMTPEQELTFRAAHAMADGEPTRARIAAAVQVEMEGLGISSGWWESVEAS